MSKILSIFSQILSIFSLKSQIFSSVQPPYHDTWELKIVRCRKAIYAVSNEGVAEKIVCVLFSLCILCFKDAKRNVIRQNCSSFVLCHFQRKKINKILRRKAFWWWGLLFTVKSKWKNIHASIRIAIVSLFECFFVAFIFYSVDVEMRNYFYGKLAFFVLCIWQTQNRWQSYDTMAIEWMCLFAVVQWWIEIYLENLLVLCL